MAQGIAVHRGPGRSPACWWWKEYVPPQQSEERSVGCCDVCLFAQWIHPPWHVRCRQKRRQRVLLERTHQYSSVFCRGDAPGAANRHIFVQTGAVEKILPSTAAKDLLPGLHDQPPSHLLN